jgi:hypothetical protein
MEAPKKTISAQLKVLENRSLGGPTRLLSLSAKDLPAEGPRPLPALGRFARLRAWAGPPYAGGPLLDRPFSIHGSNKERVDFLIRVVGPGSSILG